jgi:hypothetical protein
MAIRGDRALAKGQCIGAGGYIPMDRPAPAVHASQVWPARVEAGLASGLWYGQHRIFTCPDGKPYAEKSDRSGWSLPGTPPNPSRR